MSEPGAIAALELAGIVRAYRQGDRRLRVLDRLELTLNRGQIVALVAPSGAGKTTLLQIAGLLDRPDEGTIRLGGENYANFSDRQRSAKRRRSRAGRIPPRCC